VEYVAISSDNRYLAAVVSDRVVDVWDLATGEMIAALAHDSDIRSLEFIPDNRRLVTVAADLAARIWDMTSARLLAPPCKHRGRIVQARFSPDGRLLATAGHDHVARLWDVATAQPVSPPLRHELNVENVQSGPDGRQVAMASGDQTARVWDLRQDDRRINDLRRLSDLLTGERREADGSIKKLDARELDGIWQALREKYPADFALPPGPNAPPNPR
jgi:WD40 repeat protein